MALCSGISPRFSASFKSCTKHSGADFVGKRLNTLYAESVNEAPLCPLTLQLALLGDTWAKTLRLQDEIIKILTPMFADFAQARFFQAASCSGETSDHQDRFKEENFGNWLVRTGIVKEILGFDRILLLNTILHNYVDTDVTKELGALVFSSWQIEQDGNQDVPFPQYGDVTGVFCLIKVRNRGLWSLNSFYREHATRGPKHRFV